MAAAIPGRGALNTQPGPLLGTSVGRSSVIMIPGFPDQSVPTVSVWRPSEKNGTGRSSAPLWRPAWISPKDDPGDEGQLIQTQRLADPDPAEIVQLSRRPRQIVGIARHSLHRSQKKPGIEAHRITARSDRAEYEAEAVRRRTQAELVKLRPASRRDVARGGRRRTECEPGLFEGLAGRRQGQRKLLPLHPELQANPVLGAVSILRAMGGKVDVEDRIDRNPTA